MYITYNKIIFRTKFKHLTNTHASFRMTGWVKVIKKQHHPIILFEPNFQDTYTRYLHTLKRFFKI